MSKQIAFLRDCMEGMREYPDKYFDLAVVDPPYGGVKQGGYMKNNCRSARGPHTYYENIAVWSFGKPPKEYFDELFRVSKDQIIWGWNNYPVEIGRDTQSFIVWDKCKPDTVSFSPCEIAWTSHDMACKLFRFRWNGFMQENMKVKEHRIHPTQKPVALYEWIFANYAKPGMKILDTHLGSGSSRIAAYHADLDFVGFEIDPGYFAAQEKRWEEVTSQIRIML